MFDIVINPYGATGGALRTWKKIQPVFDENKIEYSVHFSSQWESITDIVAKLTMHPCDLMIVGGDGTLNQAVNGIADFEHTRLAMISTGSGNDFARSQNYDKDPVKHVLKLLHNSEVRLVDVGEVVYHNMSSVSEQTVFCEDGFVHRRFMISAGIGFDAAICHEAQISKWKKVLNIFHLGKLIYIVTAIHIIATARRVQGSVQIGDTKKEYSKLLLAVIMNEPYEGGGFKFCPYASDNDRLLDMCIADHLSQFDFFRIFPYAYKGGHLKFKGIESLKSEKEIHVKTNEPLWVHTDGETPCMSSDIFICLDTRKLKLITY